MTDSIKMLVDNTLVTVTDNFSKSYSVNRKYTVASEIVYAQLIEAGGYDFDLLLEWIKSMNDVWYKDKWKTTKRFIYVMDDIYHNKDSTKNGKFIYFNCTSKYQLIRNDDRLILDKYIESITFRNKDKTDIRNNISCFLLYLNKNDISIQELNYECLNSFIKIDANNHASKSIFDRLLNNVSHFLMNCYENNVVDNVLFSFVMNCRVNIFFDHLVQNSFQLDQIISGNNESISAFCDKIPDFKAFLENHEYSKHHISHVDYIIKQFALFCDLYNANICKENIDFYVSIIIKQVFSSYKQNRTILYRYLDFINNLEIKLAEPYRFKLKNYDSKCPSWAKESVNLYLDYRKRIGCKKSTLEMDANSILRFLLYLERLDIHDYSLITVNHLIDFRESDNHSTVEGKNAYIIRIRQFLCFLEDQGILFKHFNFIVFRSFRLPQKLVSVIDENTLDLIFKSKDQFNTVTELRDYCLFLLGVRMGLRATDAISLKKSDISFKEMTISFMQAKTQKHLTLPMPVMVANSIFRYLKALNHNTKSDYLFQTICAPYNPPSKCACNKAIRDVYNKLGLPLENITFHTLRKTYASNIVKNSHSISDAAFVLGHSDNSTVDKYLYLDCENMKRCTLDLHLIPYGGFES